MQRKERVSAGLLVEGRRRAGLTQAELARRARIPRSVLNAYERGHRQPGADALADILRAAGFALCIRDAPGGVDPDRAAHVLNQVLDLVDALPHRRRGKLGYPPFRRVVVG